MIKPAKLPPVLQPWRPEGSAGWDALRAGHLLNRAGFGGTPEEVAHLVEMGVDAAVDVLLDFPDAPAAEQTQDLPDDSVLAEVPMTNRDRRLAFFQVRGEENTTERDQLQQKIQRASADFLHGAADWWINRMAYGPHPLQERLTLFWHGHFTSSFRDMRQASWRMWTQNELLRRFAAGNFREMVRQISRDPAMLGYLNNDRNVKQRPNENYARELMELFTLGIGNYTETDIKQAARAFTGWGHDGVEFRFNARQHDDEPKLLFGRRGNFGGDEVVELLMMHPACAPYITGRLYHYFVGLPADSETAEALAGLFRESNFELRPVLRTILRSRAFFAAERIGGKIKSPVQLLAGTCRLLGARIPEVRVVRRELEKMGQLIFEPPNVKGWPGQFDGRKWINTATLLARYNACLRLVREAKPELEGMPRETSAYVDALLTRLLPRPLDEGKRRQLIDVAGGEEGHERVLELIVSLPEYQLC